MSLMAVAGARHCQEAGCGQLDFLPFPCDQCRKTLCLQHHKYADHTCTFDRSAINQMPACPVCSQFILVPAGASPDAIVNAHILSKCTAHLLVAQQQAGKSALSAATRCDQPTGCRNPDKMATLQCKKCGKQFCIAHRLEATHRCEGVPSPAQIQAAKAEQGAKGKALLEKMKAKREAKAAEQAIADREHAKKFPVRMPAAAAASSSASAGYPGAVSAASSSAVAPAASSSPPAALPPSSSSAAALPPGSKARPYMTLQQIRAGINSARAAAVSAMQSVLPASLAPESAAAAGAGSTSRSASPAAPAPPAVAQAPVALNLGSKRAARGDSELNEDLRRYLIVDVSSLKRRRVPQLCFFHTRHTVGRILDLICDEAGIENANHIAGGSRLYLTCLRLGTNPLPAEFTLQSLEGVLVDGDTIVLTRQKPQQTDAANPTANAAAASS